MLVQNSQHVGKAVQLLTFASADTENPICIGEPTSYCITVVNQGSEADSNVVVTVRFPKEITPVSCNWRYTRNSFWPRQSHLLHTTTWAHVKQLRYRVDARAKESGDARVVVEVIIRFYQDTYHATRKHDSELSFIARAGSHASGPSFSFYPHTPLLHLSNQSAPMDHM